MSGYEEQLHARAEMLEETGELAAAVTAILAGASGAGVDPRAITSLRAAIRALDPAGGPPGYQAGSRTDRHPGSGYGSDAEFLEAVSDAEDQTARLAPRRGAAAGTGHRRARQGPRRPGTRATGPASRPAGPGRRVRHAHQEGLRRLPRPQGRRDRRRRGGHRRARRNGSGTPTRRIGICEDTAEILDPLTRRLQAALQALRQVPHDLGEVYELIYEFIRRGGKMPRLGRWITGETPVPA